MLILDEYGFVFINKKKSTNTQIRISFRMFPKQRKGLQSYYEPDIKCDVGSRMISFIRFDFFFSWRITIRISFSLI